MSARLSYGQGKKRRVRKKKLCSENVGMRDAQRHALHQPCVWRTTPWIASHTNDTSNTEKHLYMCPKKKT